MCLIGFGRSQSDKWNKYRRRVLQYPPRIPSWRNLPFGRWNPWQRRRWHYCSMRDNWGRADQNAGSSHDDGTFVPCVVHSILQRRSTYEGAEAEADYLGTVVGGMGDSAGDIGQASAAVGIQHSDSIDAGIGGHSCDPDTIVSHGGGDAGAMGTVAVLHHRDLNPCPQNRNLSPLYRPNRDGHTALPCPQWRFGHGTASGDIPGLRGFCDLRSVLLGGIVGVIRGPGSLDDKVGFGMSILGLAL